MLIVISTWFDICSIQFSRSVMSDSLWPHEPQHAKPHCPSPTPRVLPNPCPLSWWCHPTISSSVLPFSSCPQSLPASESFPMSQLFAPGGQSIGVSASASVLPVNTQDWSPLGWTGWISLQSKGLSRVFSNTTVQKHQFFGAQPSSQSDSHIHTWPLEKRNLPLPSLPTVNILCADLQSILPKNTFYNLQRYSKIPVDDDCSHEIKRCLLLGRKAATNPQSMLKSKDNILPTKSV